MAVSPLNCHRKEIKGSQKENTMGKYRFVGTLKECERSSGNKVLRFVPDQECATAENRDDEKVKYVVLLPQKGGEGIVFEYKDKVAFKLKTKSKWLPNWKPDGHYVLVLKLIEEVKYDIEVESAPISKYFEIESVTEKA